MWAWVGNGNPLRLSSAATLHFGLRHVACSASLLLLTFWTLPVAQTGTITEQDGTGGRNWWTVRWDASGREYSE